MKFIDLSGKHDRTTEGRRPARTRKLVRSVGVAPRVEKLEARTLLSLLVGQSGTASANFAQRPAPV